ncbi:Hydroxyacylglutathione_hydrolase [Hexamita inflata]|uniref:Hydroxyacylglutathione hydrolase n=1 Tax=Hexamita inflata TaxID=28002 RepID=A0AA86USJ0_9EUKA|nr:Hydroxyacylglutathione hydrolase [Hexamita inflata]
MQCQYISYAKLICLCNLCVSYTHVKTNFVSCVPYNNPTNTTVLVDPGDRSEKIQDYISVYDFNITHILLTHAHFDHLFRCGFFKSLFPAAKLLVHQNEFRFGLGTNNLLRSSVLKCQMITYINLMGHLRRGYNTNRQLQFRGCTHLVTFQVQCAFQIRKLKQLLLTILIYPGHGGCARSSRAIRVAEKMI